MLLLDVEEGQGEVLVGALQHCAPEEGGGGSALGGGGGTDGQARGRRVVYQYRREYRE